MPNHNRTVDDTHVSQTGIVTFLVGCIADNAPTCNLLEWVSTKQKRVTKSTLAAETLAVSEGVDRSKFIQSLITTIFGFEVPLHVFSDNKSLVTTSTQTTTVRERGLIMDIAAIREGVSKSEFTLEHISTTDQLADCFTKKMTSDLFLSCVKLHKLPTSVSSLIVSHMNKK